MNLFLEFLKLIIFLAGIVVVSKYLLVPILQKISNELNLSAKSSGNIAGIATSIPELLTVVFSVKTGLIDTSVYNIISSNIINFCQYIFSVYINKNQKYFRYKPVVIDIVLVLATIVIPIFIIIFKIDLDLKLCAFFIIMLILFFYINHNVHKLYLKKEDEEIIKNVKETKNKTNKFKLIIYIFGMFPIVFALYYLGDSLSETLSILATKFNLPEIALGFVLGFLTSVPELITFTESQKKENLNESEFLRKVGVIEATNNLLTSNMMNLFVVQTLGILLFL